MEWGFGRYSAWIATRNFMELNHDKEAKGPISEEENLKMRLAALERHIIQNNVQMHYLLLKTAQWHGREDEAWEAEQAAKQKERDRNDPECYWDDFREIFRACGLGKA